MHADGRRQSGMQKFLIVKHGEKRFVDPRPGLGIAKSTEV
jgi:hypothetical protein